MLQDRPTKVSFLLTSLYEKAIVASITAEHQHRADIAVGQVEHRRERLTWAAVAFGSLGVEVPGEPHWPLSGPQRLLLRFEEDHELRLAVLGRCVCGEPVALGSIDPRLPDALAALGEAAQAHCQCEGCARSERLGRHVLEVT